MRLDRARRAADGTGHHDRRRADTSIGAALLVLAAGGWWWSIDMAGSMDMSDSATTDMAMVDPMSMSMSMSAYLVGWVAMMAAMMFPAIVPMVRMYARAASRRTIAPVPFFVSGYLAVWAAIGLPAYFAWRALADPLADGTPWVGRLAGATFVLAAAYQLTPLKTACLQHCRSPISFFLHHGGTTLETPRAAVRLGLAHGTYCLGCCWAIMAVLVAVGTMHLGWMVLLTALIALEKLSPRGERIALAAGAFFAGVGTYLLVVPAAVTTIT